MNLRTIKNLDNLSNLEILKASYEEPLFKLTGKNWEFVSNAPWRLIKNHELITGSVDFDISILEKNLIHAKIVLFEEVNNFCPGNLIVHLSDGGMIEFFKNSRSNNWQIKVNGQIITGINQ